MIVVNRVDNFLFAVLENLPYGAADHVTTGQSGDLQTLAFAFQVDRLRVLELLDLVECVVDVVQIEEVELFRLLLRLEIQKQTKMI